MTADEIKRRARRVVALMKCHWPSHLHREVAEGVVENAILDALMEQTEETQGAVETALGGGA